MEIVRDTPEMELVTIEDQMLDEVTKSDTKFIVDPIEDPYSWERALIFFKRYTTGEIPTTDPSDELATVLSNSEAAKDKYLYLVRRRWEPGQGFSYEVQCLPRFSKTLSNQAALNARNLSRFIREGTLEVSLLDY